MAEPNAPATPGRERTAPPSTRRRAFGVALAFTTGLGVAVQSRINGTLGTRLDNGVVAALISFGTGLVLLGILLLANPAHRRRFGQVAAALREHRLQWWHLLGGLSGAFLVASQGLTVTIIGVAIFTVATVGGQLASSLWVDRIGLGPAGKSPITRRRAIGAAIALVAVIVSTSDGLTAGSPSIALAILPALAGFALAWQQAVNGRVGMAGGPIVAATINFVVGTAALIIAAVAVVLVRGVPKALPPEPYLYLGGVIGVLFIATSAVVVRWIGVLLLGLTAISGQLVGAVLIDLLLPTGAGLSVTAVVGCVLTLFGVAIAAGVTRLRFRSAAR